METIIYSLYLAKLEQLQKFERRITTPPFSVMVGLAIGIHIVLLLVVSAMLPKGNVLSIPIRELSLHLGGGKNVERQVDDQNMANRMAEALASMTPATGADESEILAQFEAPPPPAVAPKKADAPEKPKPTPKKNTAQTSTRVMAAPKVVDIEKALSKQQSPAPAATTEAAAPSTSGNSEVMDTIRQQQVMSRYEQKLSAWINQYKVYPKDAFNRGIQGNVVLRIRIDRAGYVKFILIQQSSGYDVLDQAVIDAAKKANPVPAVPADYPGGQLLEFLIPIKFELS